MTSFIYSVEKCGGKVPASPISVLSLFAAFLGTLPRLIEDERDLCGCCGWDSSVDAWITAADASLAATKAACASVVTAPAAGEVDRCMQRVARLFMDVIKSADPGEVFALRANARLRRWAYRVPGEIAGACHINQRINMALDALERWLALEDTFDTRAQAWTGLDLERDAGSTTSA